MSDFATGAAVPIDVGIGESGYQLCLDFINTVSWRTSELPREHLASFQDLVSWASGRGVLTSEMAETLAAGAARHPEAAAGLLQRAVSFRDALYRLFSRIAANQSTAAEDLSVLNGYLPGAMGELRVAAASGRFVWKAIIDEATTDQMLRPVARSAAALLTSQSLDRVRECGGEGCGWLFLDLSKNRSRRWCDMSDCGNRAKARRFYARKRAVDDHA